MGGISIWQLLIIAVIIVLLFGTKKLRGVGSDLGSAVKGFKNAIGEEKKQDDAESKSETLSDTTTQSSKDVDTAAANKTKETDQA